MTLPSDFSSANLKVGNSLPARMGSGTLFMKFGSPAAADFGSVSVAVIAAANPAAAAMKSRLGTLGIGIHLLVGVNGSRIRPGTVDSIARLRVGPDLPPHRAEQVSEVAGGQDDPDGPPR